MNRSQCTVSGVLWRKRVQWVSTDMAVCVPAEPSVWVCLGVCACVYVSGSLSEEKLIGLVGASWRISTRRGLPQCTLDIEKTVGAECHYWMGTALARGILYFQHLLKFFLSLALLLKSCLNHVGVKLIDFDFQTFGWHVSVRQTMQMYRVYRA